MSKGTSVVFRDVLRTAVGETTAASDRDLLHRFASTADQTAFAVLFRRHSGMVLGVCRRVLSTEQDAEDACQATFLLLSRKASSRRWRDSIANWLYLTARRVARNARVVAERRQRRERKVAVPELSRAADRMSGRELLDTLDLELARLPDVYREPLVLCYLESLTRDEAAARLRLPAATVKTRLERGRRRLGDALAKRGWVSGAGLLALAATSPARSFSPQLLQAILKASAGSPSVVSANLARSFTFSALGTAKVIGAISMAVLVALSVGTFKTQSLGSAGISVQEGASLTLADESKNTAAETTEITLRGRVLGVDGKPFSGASLILLSKENRPIELGSTRSNGEFAVKAPNAHRLNLVARAEGFGIDFRPIAPEDKSSAIELRLVQDRPVQGRLIDMQGKPVAGARVRVKYIGAFVDDSVDSFLAAWKKMDEFVGLPATKKGIWQDCAPMFPATTDADGRFTLRGLGEERIVGLEFSGAGIADGSGWVVTRQGFDPKPYNAARRANSNKGNEGLLSLWQLFGPEPAFVMEAEKPIRGTLVAADTGKGRPGVEVWVSTMDNFPTQTELKGTTDASGRYEIHGARMAKTYTLAVRNDTVAGYLGCQIPVAGTPGYEPVTVDVRVKKGVILTGKVFDKSTGKPLPSFILTDPLYQNPFVKEYPNLGGWHNFGLPATEPDGSYRVVTIPGHILLMAGPDSSYLPDGSPGVHRYRIVWNDPQYPQYFAKGSPADTYLSHSGRALFQMNWCKVLDLDPGKELVHQDLFLEQATSLPIVMRDEAGKPLTGVRVKGASPVVWWHSPYTCPRDTCAAYDVDPEKPRQLVFFEPTRKLAASITVKGDEKTPVPVTLRPTGQIKGRVTDEEGVPLTGLAVNVNYRDRVASGVVGNDFETVLTGPDGTFVLDAVLPERSFALYFSRRGQRFTPAAKPLAVEPLRIGETRDLGDLALRSRTGN
jgi:RNA polymerase sigma factor (sigma-70 family)